MRSTPTLVCVHAHPDDEALFTAGTTSHYASVGFRVVLVTCTNGEMGLDPEGRAGNESGHDPEATRALRAGELQRAAGLVGYERVISLGYQDSGMRGWAQNANPQAFVNVDVDACAATLAALFDEVQATVVVTYDERGLYGHPDHVAAHDVTRRAVSLAASPQRLYYPVLPRGVLAQFVPAARAEGVSLPAWVTEAGAGTPDDAVATTMDVAHYGGTKQAAIATHASQSDNADLVTMDTSLFSLLFGVEYFQRAWERTTARNDTTDLFGGLI